MTLRILQFLIVLVPALLLAFVLAPGAPSNAASQTQRISDGVPAHTPVADPAALAEARRLQQLGVSHEMNGRLAEASEAQQQALDLLRGAMGDGHPLVQAQRDRVQTLQQQRGLGSGGAAAR